MCLMFGTPRKKKTKRRKRKPAKTEDGQISSCYGPSGKGKALQQNSPAWRDTSRNWKATSQPGRLTLSGLYWTILRHPAGCGATAAALAFGQFTAIAGRTSKLRFGFTTYQWGSEWDIPTIIANCTQAKALGVEVRTSAKYKHGVEPDISESRRREVKRLFADSPVNVI